MYKGNLLFNIEVVKSELAMTTVSSQSNERKLLNDGTLGTNINEFNFSNGWIYEKLDVNEAYGGDDHWTTQIGASVFVRFVSSKFYIVAIKDPNHGIMTISIDGLAEIDIDLYASKRTFKQIVYESDILSNVEHKILLKCSGRKNLKASGNAAFIDGIFIESLSNLTFLNDNSLGMALNQFNFSNGWIYENLNVDQAYNGDDHWTLQTGATVTTTFKGSKFYIIAVKDPNHGIMEVSIDNGNPIDVDLYNDTRIFKQIVFESGDLINSNHTVMLKCSGRKNTKASNMAAFIDGIFVLDNGGIGLFEIEKPQYSFNENVGVATIKVIRKGGAIGNVSVDYKTFSGTALESINYQSWSGNLFFYNGEKEKIINIPIINTNEITNSKSFTLKLSNPLGGSILGLIAESNINLLPKFNTIGTLPQTTTPINLALKKQAIASSSESAVLAANYVTDGNVTRWASKSFTNGPQWIYIDLAQILQFNTIKINWFISNATVYRIEISNDITNWTSVYRTTNGVGKEETIPLNSMQSARYVRVFCEQNNNMPSNNVSIYEIEIYNIPIVSMPSTSNLALKKSVVSSSNESNLLTPNYITDGKSTRWASGSFVNGPQWVYIDLAYITQFNTLRISWYTSNATIYRIETSNDAVNWNSVYRTTTGGGNIETIRLTSRQSARYVRVYCEKNNNINNNVSIYEIEIYNLQ